MFRKRQYLPVYNASMWGMFVLLCVITFCLLLIKKSFIESETAAFEVLEMEGSSGIFQAINTLQYLTIPVVYLFKFSLTGFLIWAGSSFFGYRLSFREAFYTVLLAEFIFIIPELLKIGYFLFIDTDPTLYEVRSFYPFSLMNLANPETLPKKWFYPFKAINIFELGYIFLLIFLLHSIIRKKRSVIIYLVLTVYVIPFIGWLFYYTTIYKS